MKQVFKNPMIGFLLAMFCTMCFGISYPLTKITQSAFSVQSGDIGAQLLLAGVRLTASGILILLMGCCMRAHSKLQRGDLLKVGAVSLFLVVLHYGLTYLGQGLSDGSKAPLLKETCSLFLIVFMHLFSKDDRLNWKKSVGCMLGLAGIIVVNIGNIEDSSYFNMNIGELCLLLAAICAAFGYCLMKLFFKNISSSTAMGMSQLLGGAIMVLVGAACGGKLIPENSIAYLYLFAIILATAIPFLIWTELYKYNRASIMGIYGLTTSLFGVVATGLLIPGATVFSWKMLFATVLIILGMWVANSAHKTSKDNAEEI